MATFIEATVEVVLEVKREASGEVRIWANGRSRDADGQVIRRLSVDITDQLSQARRDGATSLVVDVESRLKTLWQIP